MINYIIQVVLFQVLFLVIYDVFLAKETFFNTNRAYLLGTLGLSFVLPAIKFSFFEDLFNNTEEILLPEVVFNPEKSIQLFIEPLQESNSISWISVLLISGIVVFLILFIYKLVRILNLISANKTIKKSKYNLIKLQKTSAAFSFFRYIFIGESIESNQVKNIIQHELVHVKEKHSYDLVFLEILRIVMWFNPMLFIYQKRLLTLHEFIADKMVIKKVEKEHYVDSLLSQFFSVQKISFINQFYKKSLIKKRIAMILKKQSNRKNQLKYLLLLPLIASMLSYIACSDSFSDNSFDEQKMNLDAISFLKVDEAPTFPGCERGDKNCFSQKVQQHFIRNFDQTLPKKLGLSNGRKRIFISFTVNTEGKIVDLKNRTPHEVIDEEVESIMSKLPRMIPGESGGNKVNVRYSIPIVIQVGDKSDSLEALNEIVYEIEERQAVSIDKQPNFSGCKEGDKDCFSENIQQLFLANFNNKLPKEIGLESGRKRIFVSFKVDKLGAIKDIKVRAPHKRIEEEVIRVMKQLPRIIPGENNGEKVEVNYSLPFTIIVE